VLDANPWKHTTTPPLGRRHPASSLSLRMDMNHGPSAIMPRREQDAAFPAVVLHVLQTAHHKGNAAETEDAADGCRPTPRTTQPSSAADLFVVFRHSTWKREGTGQEGWEPTSSYSRSRIQSLSTSSYDRQGSPPAPRPPTGSAKASRRGIGSAAAAAGSPAWGCPAAPVAGLGRSSCLSRWAARPWGGFGIAVGGAI